MTCKVALIDALLDKITNHALRSALREQVAQLLNKQSFGLVFQQHKPETVELYNHTVRRNCKVRIKTENGDELYLVDNVKKGTATIRSLVDEPEFWDIGVQELVVVREFGDPIYPGLISTGKVTRGGDKPAHLVINAENFHALETLLYTHEGKVDAIYIDPPYNTRDKDWKYNNDYVDSDDVYRHSKWLAMMQRRLELARRLLNSEDSVLIVTIDEKEVHRLGLLLEQIFIDAAVSMVSSVISPQGSARPGGFSRVEEYIFFVRLGNATVSRTGDDMLIDIDEAVDAPVWFSMIRSGTGAKREDSKNLFYPIFISESDRSVVAVGNPLPLGVDRRTVAGRKGCTTVWPIRRDGSEGRWQLSAATFLEYVADGFAKIGEKNNTGGWSVMYVRSGDRQRILDGDIVQTGVDQWGARIYKRVGSDSTSRIPKSIWNRLSHDAGKQGSMLLGRMLPGRKFPFPKSLYAVEDALRFFVRGKPDAIVLDFFAGSGTTAHAVMRLNKQDGGRRQTILVTNNEVSADEQVSLKRSGFHPGDKEWERLGICEYITKPRVAAAITGLTPDGVPIKGKYKFIDEFPMAQGFEENAEFFNLTYEDPDRIGIGRGFEALAPLLWLRAGGIGDRIDTPVSTWSLPEHAVYGVLFDTDQWREFIDAVIKRGDAVSHVYVVTDSEAVFQKIVSEVPAGVAATQLYEDYLRTFEINTKGRA